MEAMSEASPSKLRLDGEASRNPQGYKLTSLHTISNLLCWTKLVLNRLAHIQFIKVSFDLSHTRKA